jgi:hypothetical protein
VSQISEEKEIIYAFTISQWLSDYFFILARYLHKIHDIPENKLEIR